GAGCGMVFELSPNGDGTWTQTDLHDFDKEDGQFPVAGLTLDKAGNLYGTTLQGGGEGGHAGEGFKLRQKNGAWDFTELCHVLVPRIAGREDPESGVTFDRAGNIYGTTKWWGRQDNGVVYELRRNDAWKLHVIQKFTNQQLGEGAEPTYGNLIFDKAGNLY